MFVTDVMVLLIPVIYACIIGAIAKRWLQQTGAGIFYGILTLVLSGLIDWFFEAKVLRPPMFLADGIYRSGPSGDVLAFIAFGLGGAIVLAIVTMLRKQPQQ